MSLDDEIRRDYLERIRVLRELDIPAFVATLPPHAQAMYKANPPEKREEIALASMHKARYELLEMSDAERAVSRAWLEAHGMGRLRGQDFPEQGRTPLQ